MSRPPTPQRILPPLPPEARYRLKTYVLRALLNTLGPPVVLTLYAFLVYFYIVNNDASGIVPYHPINARVVYYSWLVLSAFVIAWAKVAIAGFEAAALGRPSLAPANAAKLMWHSDKIWSEFTGWVMATAVTYRYLKGKATGRRHVQWDGPSPIWFHLALSSVILHIAIPLAGLSMEFSSALRFSDRPAIIVGANETTFNSRHPDSVAEQANARWRLGGATTPEGASIIYAPGGTPDVSNRYFEDAVQANYRGNLNNPAIPLNQTIDFFTGPAVAERVHGRAWGLLNKLACTVVNPYSFSNGDDDTLRLLNVTGVNAWSYNGGLTTSESWTDVVDNKNVHISNTTFFGLTYNYVVANNVPHYSFDSHYRNASEFPLRGRLELVLWQTFDQSKGAVQDENFKKLATHPLVEASVNPVDNLTYLGYAVSCAAQTSTGQATLNARTNTYSDFVPQAAGRELGQTDLASLAQRTGLPQIQSLVYTALTSITPELLAPSRCDLLIFPGCDAIPGANSATGGVPIFFSESETFNPNGGRPGSASRIQAPSISSERMVLALQKLFGEVAIAAMSSGPGNWTSTPFSLSSSSDNSSTPSAFSPPANDASADPARFLYALDPVPNILPGIIPYMYPLVLLAIWVLLTVLPQLHPSIFLGKRWAPYLDGITMFRLGAEWTGHVHRLHTGELTHLGGTSLREIPGMIGDMNAPATHAADRGSEKYRGTATTASGFEKGAQDFKMRMMLNGGYPGGIDDDQQIHVNEFGFVGLSTRPARTDGGRAYTLRRGRV